jgi:apolipoprotein N-acyltransferase
MRVLAVLVAAVTAALVHFGAGLHPYAGVTWLIALPALLFATRRPQGWLAPASAAVGVAAGFAGMWTYGRTSLELSPPLLLAYLGTPALLFGLIVAGFGRLVARRRFVAAALWVPAAWTGGEYLIATFTPAGTFLSLATSQASIRPVLNLAALTGGWGISFLLMLAPAVAAAVVAAGVRPRSRTVVLLAGVVPLVAGLGYGNWAAHRAPATERLRVAMVALPQPASPVDVTTPAGTALLAQYAARIEALSGSGVRLVVLPEKTFATDDASRARVMSALRTAGADVVVGLSDSSPAGLRNLAVYRPSSGGAVTYAKRHLIPGVESGYRAGDGTPVTAAGPGAVRIRLLVCKDLDFPGLVRRGGGEQIVAAPAWDFDTDGWLHSRIAVLRAVENGTALVRTARDGALVAADPTGRIVGNSTQTGTPDGAATGTNVVIADLPVPPEPANTPYCRFGDWFAWLALLAAALTGVLMGRPAKSAQPAS